MDDTQYLQHCRGLWHEFASTLARRTTALDEQDPLRLLAEEFLALPEADLYRDGAALALRLFSHHPEFAPTFPRSLLWFLGGDCLHVMTDEEIATFQALDEERLAAAERGDTFAYRAEASARLRLP
ncbi:PA2817 family protein [Haliea sp. E1-2-M8]|uniref:PA2817 family protein n=1 Tax=Haliea sp. E1-2-M8 TaxID=3064706 RepID=UPI00271C74EE|nr:PA2817 family protein [Haliea sp. E1-2-M8]MDO8863894.1 PA2817 family protein [Haliea sp. E1-2-M8]